MPFTSDGTSAKNYFLASPSPPKPIQDERRTAFSVTGIPLVRTFLKATITYGRKGVSVTSSDVHHNGTTFNGDSAESLSMKNSKRTVSMLIRKHPTNIIINPTLISNGK